MKLGDYLHLYPIGGLPETSLPQTVVCFVKDKVLCQFPFMALLEIFNPTSFTLLPLYFSLMTLSAAARDLPGDCQAYVSYLRPKTKDNCESSKCGRSKDWGGKCRRHAALETLED